MTVSSGASPLLSVSFSEPDFRLLSPTIHEGEGQVQLRFNVWEKGEGNCCESDFHLVLLIEGSRLHFKSVVFLVNWVILTLTGTEPICSVIL